MKASRKSGPADSTSYDVPSADQGLPLVDFLAHRIGISKKKAKQLLDARRVFVNDRRVWMAKHRMKAGDRVDVASSAPSPAVDRSLVLYQDDNFMIVNKPPGMLSNGPGSLEHELRRTFRLPRLTAVHRLDRDTSGCLLLARSARSREEVLPLFRDRKIRKTYRAIVHGRFPAEKSRISLPLEGRSASTRLKVLKATGAASHLRVEILTGRTHQIRKHLASVRHPVVGDKAYAAGLALSDGLKAVPRQMLHAEGLSFVLPRTGERVSCSAPLPRDFKDCLRKLSLKQA